ncbi:MAG: urease accessory UreF family protein [Pseudomonadota bacterium]
MTDALAMVRVMAWLSPAFPTGGFAYSAGLETAAHEGLVDGEDTLLHWVSCQLTQGTLLLDAKLVSLSHRAQTSEVLTELQSLARALAGSEPRWRETLAQGDAFLAGIGERREFADMDAKGTLKLSSHQSGCPLAVAIGAATAHGGVARSIAIIAFLQSAVGQQLSAAIRLNLMGQSGAARLLDRLEASIVGTMESALNCTIDDLTSATPIADILAARHSTLDGRLFLS